MDDVEVGQEDRVRSVSVADPIEEAVAVHADADDELVLDRHQIDDAAGDDDHDEARRDEARRHHQTDRGLPQPDEPVGDEQVGHDQPGVDELVVGEHLDAELEEERHRDERDEGDSTRRSPPRPEDRRRSATSRSFGPNVNAR